MPFSDDGGFVAGLLEDARGGGAARLDDERRISGKHACAAFAPGVFTGEKGIAGGRAGGRGGMRVGEAKAFAREAIDVRRLDTGGAVATEIAIAKVIGVDQD